MLILSFQICVFVLFCQDKFVCFLLYENILSSVPNKSEFKIAPFLEASEYKLQGDTPSMMTTTYAIRKIPSQPKEPVVVDVDDIKEFTWIAPLQKIIEERLNEPDYKTIWLTSTKVRNNGLLGLALCFK